MPSSRAARSLIGLAFTALLVTLVPGIPVYASPAAPALSVRSADSTLSYGQRLVVTGDVGSRVRPLQLQRAEAGQWRTVLTGRSQRNGTFSLTETTSRTGAYRVVAPAVRAKKARLPLQLSNVVRSSWQSTLSAPATLGAGQGVRSASGRYVAVMQQDGNFVVYDQGVAPQVALWSTQTQEANGSLSVQQDGNVVIYSASGVAKWSSETAPAGNIRLTMQDDGNLVLYSRGGLAMWSTLGGRTTTTGDSISPRTTLQPGQELVSRNEAYRAAMQPDGNFVVYGPGGAEWSTQTGSPGSSLTLQEDGNLVVYAGGAAQWSSETAQAAAVRLQMQNDGNFVIYSRGGLALWSSRGGKTGYAENTLPAGTSLSESQRLWSNDGRFQAVMQGDGNFVVYGPSGATWSSGTSDSGSSVHMQADGNLVVYAPGGVARWNSGSSGSGARLVMQNDGNLVVYVGSDARWSSNANGAPGVGGATGSYPDSDAVPCGRSAWCKGGSELSGRGFAYRNCTDFVAWKRGMTWGQIQSGGTGHAYAWKAGWESRGRTVSTTPRVGAVAYWPATNGNPYGHVAYVLAVNGDGSVRIAEFNYNFNGNYHERNARAPHYLY